MPLLTEGSSIIMASSLAARTVVGNLSAYAATKGAISTLVKHFAVALGANGIRVNGIAPGVIDTHMSSFTHTKEGREIILTMQTFKRIGKPDDVGAVVAFLASDEARWVTGDILTVSGGSKL